MSGTNTSSLERKGPGRDPELFHQPGAKILQGDDMTSPSANEPAEDQSRENSKGKKDESGVDRSVLERVHRLRRFDRRDGTSRDAPLNEMGDHQEV
jgi:hypothetical protein